MKFLWIAVFAFILASSRVTTLAAAAPDPSADDAWAQIVQSSKNHADPGQLAVQLKAFYEKYPNHPKASTAWIQEQKLRQAADGAPVAKVSAPAPMAVVDKSLNGQVKEANARIRKAQQFSREAGLGEMERSGRKLADQFPKDAVGWKILFDAADGFGGEKARQLYTQIAMKAPAADLKRAATARLQTLKNSPASGGGSKLIAANEKHISLSFTATDGRPVDLSQMAGKVVLIDFWATWCGPCREELPNVKKAYAEFHDKGFEIVGVSFDNDIQTLQRFTASNDMPWPQFCDGGGWQNAINKDFGINAIPAMYLVDKKGMLRDTHGRENLAEKIRTLLAEN
jgi:thiol-disulfide isomerase/thioredoxin